MAAEAIPASEVEGLIQGASNWDQVLERFSGHVKPNPNADSSTDAEHMVTIDLTHQLFWNLEEKVIEQVYPFYAVFFLTYTRS